MNDAVLVCIRKLSARVCARGATGKAYARGAEKKPAIAESSVSDSVKFISLVTVLFPEYFTDAKTDCFASN